MIEKLELTNFTAFKKLTMEFSPGINIFIGQNGTGKTHLLKLIYAVLAAHSEEKRVSDKLNSVFLPKGRYLGRLVKRVNVSSTARVKITRNGKMLSLKFTNHTADTLVWNNGWKGEKFRPCVYIPVKEMLANAPGFLSLYASREIHFEEIYADIIHRAFLPTLKGPVSIERKKLLDLIQKIIEGKVINKDEQFFLKNRGGELEFTLLAEGMRKLGLLWLLIQNGTLLKGTTLFWDEPEANLNPSMLDTLVKILIHLQRTGVQIFIATHNYILLKEFDIQKEKQDKVRFYSLYQDPGMDSINYVFGTKYIDIVPNTISEAYLDIYNQEIKRSLGGDL